MKKVRIPLLKDYHNHVVTYAVLKDCIDLRAVRDKAAALRLLRTLPEERTSVVLGWNSSFYHFGDDELERLPPLVINDASLHGIIMTRGAEEKLKSRFPQVVRRYRDARWSEEHGALIGAMQIEIEGFSPAKLLDFFGFLEQKGIYYAEDMHVPHVDFYPVFKAAGLLERSAFWSSLEYYEKMPVEERDFLAGLKVFTDGSLGARTAAMTRGYLDGSKGDLLYKDNELTELLLTCQATKKKIAIHAIGDRAIDQVIRIYEVMHKRGRSFPSVRLEHAEFISLALARRAKALNIRLCMQPNFNSDTRDYQDRLAYDYLMVSNPFRMLIDEAGFQPGQDLIFGSDGMPHGVLFALQESLFPLCPGQRLELSEFIAGYCMPDLTTGHIDISIDETSRQVKLDSIEVQGQHLVEVPS